VEHLNAQPLNPIGSKHVTDEDHSAPVEYVMKIVPIAKAEPVEAPAEPFVESVPAAENIETETVETPAEPVDMITETEPAKETAAEIIEQEEAYEPVDIKIEPESPSETPIVSETKPEPEVTREPAPIIENEESRLILASPVVDAPSIGPKTAKRLEPLGIITIGDLLDADPAETVKALDVGYITLKTFYEWQDQTRLMLSVKGLRVLDAQILVGAGVRSVEALQKASAATVFQAATTFLGTPGGSRVLWGAENTLEETEVADWIERAKDAA
ncbi:MAG: DUF4332 domain-containing protein, partial [Pseudomonadota bacterium]